MFNAVYTCDHVCDMLKVVQLVEWTSLKQWPVFEIGPPYLLSSLNKFQTLMSEISKCAVLMQLNLFMRIPFICKVRHIQGVEKEHFSYFICCTGFALISTVFICWSCNLTWSRTMHVKKFIFYWPTYKNA